MARNSHAGKSRPSKFGQLLLNWRQHRDLSQAELAEMVEVSRETISHLETGKIAMPELPQLKRIVHRLKIPGAVLLRSLDLILDENEGWLTTLDNTEPENGRPPTAPGVRKKRVYHRRLARRPAQGQGAVE